MYSEILRKLTYVCSKILRKFKGTVKKLLKQAILRKFFLYFENIFRNNCVKFQVNVRKITIVGNSQFSERKLWKKFLLNFWNNLRIL